MYDIFKQEGKAYTLSDYKLIRMVLAPEHWSNYSSSVKLEWCGEKFENARANHIPKENGVYTFVVKPGIAGHPSCSYLLYVGKAEKQALAIRFKQYLTERQKGDDSRRPHVVEMLKKWDGFLWFYYATIKKQSEITEVENQLLAAFLPPSNRTFPCSVRRSICKLFAQ